MLEDDERVGEVERPVRDHFEPAGRHVQVRVGRAREMGPALLDHGRRDVDAPDHADPGRHWAQQTADAAPDFQHGGGGVEFDVAQHHLGEIVFAGGPKQSVGGGVAAADVALGVEAGAGLPFPLHAGGGLPPAGDETTPDTRTADGMFHAGSIAPRRKTTGRTRSRPNSRPRSETDGSTGGAGRAETGGNGNGSQGAGRGRDEFNLEKTNKTRPDPFGLAASRLHLGEDRAGTRGAPRAAPLAGAKTDGALPVTARCSARAARSAPTPNA